MSQRCILIEGEVKAHNIMLLSGTDTQGFAAVPEVLSADQNDQPLFSHAIPNRGHSVFCDQLHSLITHVYVTARPPIPTPC